VPEPLGKGQRYMPGLDGLRAIAVAAVIAFHLGLSWAPGGLLGVGVFFTLSGYLITDLLLGAWESSGGLKLRDFWARRARRLLPALFVMLAVVTVWVAIASPSQLGPLRGDVGAASVYVSNWWLAFQHVSYFARFGPPSPLGHLWSLAVEEQFYLIWPWLLWFGLILLVRRQRLARRRAAAAAAASEDSGAYLNGQAGSFQATTADIGGSDADTFSSGPAAQAGTTLVAHRPPAQTGAGRPGVRFARREMWPLAGATAILALLSAIEMGVLYHPGFDPSRIYDGTDTRAFGLLFGAALAMVWPSRGLRADVSPAARRFIDGMGALGLLAIGLLIWRTNEYSAFLYRGGMVLLSLATCLVVAAVAHPGGRIGRILGVGPLRWTGVRSYGIYLWHYPVIVLTTATVVAGTDLTRDFFQVAATVIIADLSWRFIETPVRKGALGRLYRKMRSLNWNFEALPKANRIALACVPVGLLVLTLCFAGVVPSAPSGVLAVASAPPSPQLVTATTDLVGTSSASTAHGSPTSAVTTPAHSTAGHSTAGKTGAAVGPSKHAGSTSAPTDGPPTTAGGQNGGQTGGQAAGPAGTGAGSFRSSCTQVAHLGDSTSESLISSTYLPDPAQRLGAQYARVGVSQSLMEIVGANSIVETLPGDQDGYQIAQGLVAQGYHGCWVIALGTNDTADVYVGSNVSLAERIRRMMSVIGNEPVLWVNVKSLLSTGPYSETDMLNWDDALLAACPSYPNMRVFNWAAMAQPQWFISDGIHYTSAGSAARSAALADALATAFPAGASTGAGVAAQAKDHSRPASASSCVINGNSSWHLPAFQY
jgi:peptidoglycan/LPS O-acetylase OafA/YrhL